MLHNMKSERLRLTNTDKTQEGMDSNLNTQSESISKTTKKLLTLGQPLPGKLWICGLA